MSLCLVFVVDISNGDQQVQVLTTKAQLSYISRIRRAVALYTCLIDPVAATSASHTALAVRKEPWMSRHIQPPGGDLHLRGAPACFTPCRRGLSPKSRLDDLGSSETTHCWAGRCRRLYRRAPQGWAGQLELGAPRSRPRPRRAGGAQSRRAPEGALRGAASLYVTPARRRISGHWPHRASRGPTVNQFEARQDRPHHPVGAPPCKEFQPRVAVDVSRFPGSACFLRWGHRRRRSGPCFLLLEPPRPPPSRCGPNGPERSSDVSESGGPSRRARRDEAVVGARPRGGQPAASVRDSRPPQWHERGVQSRRVGASGGAGAPAGHRFH